jgi:hypothetical protein
MKREARLQDILHIPHNPHLWVPQWRSPPSRSPSRNSSQRDAPRLEPSFNYFSKSPVYEPHPDLHGSPLMKGGHHGESWQYPETFLTHLPRSPVKDLPYRQTSRGLFREWRSIPKFPSSSSQIPRWKSSPPDSPNGALMKRNASLQSLFYVSFRFPGKGALPPGSL